MSVEQYSNDVVVATVVDGPSKSNVWLREEGPADLAGDPRWLSSRRFDTFAMREAAIMELSPEDGD